MNRHHRRAAAKQWREREVVLIEYGHLPEHDPNYGRTVECYVCATPHIAHSLARIERGESTTDVPLCESCRASGNSHHAVLRKFCDAPDLKIAEGSGITEDQITAWTEGGDATEH
jgi:hypothetical protein